jgi:hypothetical protein
MSRRVCCRQCQGLITTGKLDEHIRLNHGGVECPVCRSAFRGSAEMTQHLEYVHRCEICRELLASLLDRDRHLATVHGMVDSLGEEIGIKTARLEYLPGRGVLMPPENAEARLRWLYPFCLGLLKAQNIEQYLRDVPAYVRDRLEYVQPHLHRIKEAQRLARYKRLPSVQGRAKFLARVLSLPHKAASYAEQQLQKIRVEDR